MFIFYCCTVILPHIWRLKATHTYLTSVGHCRLLDGLDGHRLCGWPGRIAASQTYMWLGFHHGQERAGGTKLNKRILWGEHPGHLQQDSPDYL